MTPGGSAGAKAAGEQIWLRSPWPLLLAICGAAALWTLVAGNPFEGLEMRWFGQILRWRYERGMAQPADPSIVHVDITQVDLRKTPTLELEYQTAATIIQQAFELVAKQNGNSRGSTLAFARRREGRTSSLLSFPGASAAGGID